MPQRNLDEGNVFLSKNIIRDVANQTPLFSQQLFHPQVVILINTVKLDNRFECDKASVKAKDMICNREKKLMARPIEYVGDINDSKDLWKISVRCKHIWSVTSASKKEHLEMILVDSKGSMIQAVVPPYLVAKFKEYLCHGCSYVMQNFKVGSNYFSFKSTDHKHKLVFCGLTSLKKTDNSEIPVNVLNLLSLADIVDDVLGGVVEITQSHVSFDNSKSKVVFSITDNSKSMVVCTLWGQFAILFNEYWTKNKDACNMVVLLINARIKEAQGNCPLNVSNAWNGTKLIINDTGFEQVSKLKESFKGDFPKLSDTGVQVSASQNSQYSDFDKFVWKADVLSLAEIGGLQQETTCVTVATLDKFDVGQSGWYYDGCVDCTKSVTLRDGKLECYAKHISPFPVPRFKLEILAVDGKCNAKFIFWDVDCVKLVGKSATEIINVLKRTGEYDPLEFPYELDSILKRELAIRAVFQPKNGRLSVIGFRDDPETRSRVKENFRAEEPTSRLRIIEPTSQDEFPSVSEPLSVSADYDPFALNTNLTPSKRILSEAVEEIEGVQLSSTKLIKDIKKEE
ncbi:uncharacterized protein LOC131658209 [Vicia villosa]|uniref:uncharacterized protein LOC131658209 n=1 Tax=Vicia villosa TaxID=3911 RepID=UPI00273CD424|nr:uncharacterized protein LOC131658209 [Vicia villosa]